MPAPLRLEKNPALAQPTGVDRKRLRLAGFDYAKIGAYFVTICTANRRHLLADVVNGHINLKQAGKVVQTCWNEIPTHFAGISLDTFVIMPNHLHGILLFTDPARRGHARTLPVVVGSFKSAASRQIGDRLWQRSYWERVIRNEDELNRIRSYIDENPARWAADPENR